MTNSRTTPERSPVTLESSAGSESRITPQDVRDKLHLFRETQTETAEAINKFYKEDPEAAVQVVAEWLMLNMPEMPESAQQDAPLYQDRPLLSSYGLCQRMTSLHN